MHISLQVCIVCMCKHVCAAYAYVLCMHVCCVCALYVCAYTSVRVCTRAMHVCTISIKKDKGLTGLQVLKSLGSLTIVMHRYHFLLTNPIPIYFVLKLADTDTLPQRNYLH